MAISYQVALDGANVPTPTASTAKGTGYALLGDVAGPLEYRITVTGLDFGGLTTSFPNRATTDTTDDVTAIHIHLGDRTAPGTGSVVFNILNDDNLLIQRNADGSWTLSGAWDLAEGLTTYAGSLATTTVGTESFLNVDVHTEAFPQGEIRAQFLAQADDTANTVPGTTGNDTLLGLGGDDTLQGGIGNDSMEGGSDADRLEGGAGDDHHSGGDGTDTAVFGVAFERAVVSRGPSVGSYTILSEDGRDTVLADVENFDFAGSVLTTGQMESLAFNNQARGYISELTGDQVLTPTGSDAFGAAYMLYNPETVSVTYGLTVQGLDFGDIVSGSDALRTEETGDDVKLVHLHFGGPTVEGAPVFNLREDDDLEGTYNPDGSWTLSGTWDLDEGLQPYLADFARTQPGTPLPLYFNIHTEAFRNGEIRGQVVSATDRGANAVTGSKGADTIFGLDGADTLNGGDGDDRLDGGSGGDSLTGGLGDDDYEVTDATDVVVEAADEGLDEVTARLDTYTLGENVENLVLLGSSGGTDPRTGTGNALDNLIRAAGTTPATLNGLDGDDTLVGGQNGDTLVGGIGNDSLEGNDGANRLAGGEDNDRYLVRSADDTVVEVADQGIDRVITPLNGYTLDENVEELELIGDAVEGTGNALDNLIIGNTAQAGQLDGQGGDDTLRGGSAGDSLIGRDGDDCLEGGIGADSMFGNADNDTYLVDDAGDEVNEQADEGTDKVISSLDGYVLTDNVETLELAGDAVTGTGNALDNVIDGSGTDVAKTLLGLAGDDTIEGGAGGDSLSGGEDADVLVGGVGDDTMQGDDGEDTAAFDSAITEVALARGADGLIITSAEGVDLVKSDVELLEFDGQSFTYGEVADLIPVQRTFQVALDGGQPTTPTGSEATGTGFFTYRPETNEVRYTINIDGLDFGTLLPSAPERATEDTSDDVTVAHIHAGARGANGGVVHNLLTDDDLSGGLQSDGTWIVSGVWEAGEGLDAYATAFSTTKPGTDLELYVNIHTTSFSGGEIRGQIVSSADDTDNSIDGTGGRDTLIGQDGADTLSAGAGNDQVFGGTGADNMAGGPGDDGYTVDDAGDTIVEAVDEGRDLVSVLVDGYKLADNVEEATLFQAARSITGNAIGNALRGSDDDVAYTLSGAAGNDTLFGRADNDTLNGGGDDDILIGSGGADSMSGGTGDDSYSVDAADDIVVEAAGEGNDTVSVSLDGYALGDNVENLTLIGAATRGSGNALDNQLEANRFSEDGSTLTGLDGNDTLLGAAQGDTLNGGDGDDSLDGRGGADSMSGGEDDDTYTVENADDVVIEVENEGTDTVVTFLDGYTLGANVENLTLTGDAATGSGNALANMLDGSGTEIAKVLDGLDGDDTLLGGAEADLLDGGADDDRLIGGSGDDTNEGGGGSDTAVFSVASDAITVALAEDGLVVTSTDGADLVVDDVEFLEFSDTTLSYAQALALVPDTTETRFFQVALDEAQVGTPTGSDATGTGYVLYDAEAGTATYRVTVEGLDFGTILPGFAGRATINTDDDVTTAHIHAAARGTDGGIAFAFLEDDDLTAEREDDDSWTFEGLWEAGEGSGELAALFGSTPPAEDVDLYFNIHTTGFGSGEIRGQIVSAADSADNTVSATSGNDTILGLGGEDTLSGGDGNDVIEGGDGDDRMVGGNGDDTYRVSEAGDAPVEEAGEGTDTVVSELLAYVLGDNIEMLELAGIATTGTGNGLANTLTGDQTDLSKVLSGLGGDDTINGGAGADTIDGGTGADEMDGGAGDDSYVLDNRGDRLKEDVGGGSDSLRSTVQVNLGDAEIEEVILEGNSNLRVTGNAFATSIIGNDRGNVLVGGGGGDTLEGRGGADFFAFLSNDAPGAARIVDFTDGDQLALDDRFFGLGDGLVDPRQVTSQQIRAALDNGRASYERSSGELTIDTDGRRGPDEPEVVAIFENMVRLNADDIILF